MRSHAPRQTKPKRFLRFLAERPGVEVTADVAAEAIGLADWNALAGVLGAAGRRAGNRTPFRDRRGCSGGNTPIDTGASRCPRTSR
jgi:hypothetical protein